MGDTNVETDGVDDEGLLRCRQRHNWAVENRPAYGYWCYECGEYVQHHEHYLAYGEEDL